MYLKFYQTSVYKYFLDFKNKIQANMFSYLILVVPMCLETEIQLTTPVPICCSRLEAWLGLVAPGT